MQQFHCAQCGYDPGMLADGPGMLSARALYLCAGCRDVVSLTTRLFGENTTPDERDVEHTRAGCALPDLTEVEGDDMACPRCDGQLRVTGVGMWD